MNESRPVWVVTNADDPTSDLVITELHHRGVPVVRFDSGDFPADLVASAHLCDGSGWHGTLTTPTRKASISGARSLFYRRPSGFAFPHLSTQDARFAAAQARYGLGGIMVSLANCLYVNHPHRIGDAEYKPSGLAVAARSGFLVPPTLITNEPQAARDFIRAHDNVIYKPLHVPPYEVDGRWQTIEVRPVTPAEVDESITGTMHLFQKIVSKIGDIRTTVIGDTVFSVAITSDLLDWRTDYQALSYAVVDTPQPILRSLRAYLKSFGLVFGAFDFARTAAGEWIFLECNPSGQWAWLEPETGLPMVAAMADLLEEGTAREC